MRSQRTATVWLLALGGLTTASATGAADIAADPTDYRTLFDTLQPGDTLALAPGDYADGLRITGVNGQADAPIVVQGPATGAPAVFLARAGANTIDITESSYVATRNIVSFRQACVTPARAGQ